MSKHTPGPWKVNAQRSSGWMDNGVYIFAGTNIARVYRDLGQDVQEANAHLIAAAPDLLAALKELRTYVLGEAPSLLNGDLGGNGSLSDQIDAALALADKGVGQ